MDFLTQKLFFNLVLQIIIIILINFNDKVKLNYIKLVIFKKRFNAKNYLNFHNILFHNSF